MTEDYLCLTVEVIKQLDPSVSQDTGDEVVGGGRGIDHEHLFFSERITLCPVYAQGSDNNNSVISQYTSKRVWNRNHPDDSERYPHFSITVPELGDATMEYKEDGKVYVDGEILFGGPGNGCESFYLADIDGDGHPELCFGSNFGSGIVHVSVAIYDYETKEIIFTLSDRMHCDYYFFLRNGQLCVMSPSLSTRSVCSRSN